MEQPPSTESSPASTSQPRPSAPRTRVHSKYLLPSDRHSFGAHFEILKRFVTHSRNGAEPIAAEKVEGEGIPVQAASMNVRFMASVGLLRFDSKGLYVPTPEVVRFISAKSVSDDRARPILRGILTSSWFAELAAGILRTQPFITEEQMVGELAIATETDKARKAPALRILIEYLVFAGILSRDERGLSLATDVDSELSSGPLGDGRGGTRASESSPTMADARPSPSAQVLGEGLGWHIVQTEDYYLKVKSDPAVVDELTDQLDLIRKKITRLRSKSTVDASPPPERP